MRSERLAHPQRRRSLHRAWVLNEACRHYEAPNGKATDRQGPVRCPVSAPDRPEQHEVPFAGDFVVTSTSSEWAILGSNRDPSLSTWWSRRADRRARALTVPATSFCRRALRDWERWICRSHIADAASSMRRSTRVGKPSESNTLDHECAPRGPKRPGVTGTTVRFSGPSVERAGQPPPYATTRSVRIPAANPAASRTSPSSRCP